MKSILSLVSDAAKQGTSALCQLFAEQSDAFLEAVKWLAPIDSERWFQPLTTTIASAVTSHIYSVDFQMRRKACEIIVKAVTDRDAGESMTLLSSLLLSMRPADDDDPICSNDHIEFEQLAFDELKRCRWTGIKLVRILYFLRDIHIGNDMVDAILTNFSNGIVDCIASDIPSSCYNFIYLSQKLPDHSLAIMRTYVSSCENIITRSERLSCDARTSALHAISTAVQSFSFSAKQDHRLADALLKLLRSRSVIFGPFGFALLLSLMDSSRHQKSFSTYIYNYALDSYRNKLYKSNSRFILRVIQQVQKCDNTSDGIDIGLYEDFDDLLDHVVRYCESGWEFFVPNLVEICFHLFTFYDNSCRSGHAALMTLPIDCLNQKNLNPKILAVRAALRSLITFFNSYPASRATIVERIFNSVLSDQHLPETDNGDFSPAMELLGQLVARNEVVFFDMVPQIRNCFDHLMNMSSKQSCRLVRNLVPVVRKRKDLGDALVIIIRKSLFSRHLHHRIMAVDIMLTLVNTASGVHTSQIQFSQSSSSTQAPTSSDSQLFVEFQGLIHRVLSQQPQIRAHSYDCLHKCFENGSPALRKNIFDLLQNQLNSLMDPNLNEKLPFCIDHCIQSGTVIEPLPVLFHHFCQCVLILKLSPSSSVLYDEGCKTVCSVLERLSRCNLEDFAFEKIESANQSQATASVISAPDSIVRDNLRLSSLFWLEIHEVAINFLLRKCNELNMDNVEKIFKLHKTWERLKPSAICRPTGKRKSPEHSLVKPPYFSLKACNSILGTMYGHFDNDHNRTVSQQDVVAALRDNPEFIRYCLSSVILDVEQSFGLIRTSLQCEIFLRSCCDIVPKLFRRCLREISTAKNQVVNGSPGPRSGKSSSIACPSLELLHQLLSKVACFGSEAFCDFYRSASLHELAIFENRRESSPSNPDLFFESLEHIFSETCNDRDVILTTEASIIISMLDVCTPFFSNRTDARFDWLAEVYRFNVSVPTLSSSLLAYGYFLHHLRPSLKLLLKVAQDCVMAMGDIGEEILPTASTEYGFNCEATIPAVTARILQLIESEFTFADWLLSIIKQIGSYLKEAETLHIQDMPFPNVRVQSCLDSICFLLQKSFEVAQELLQIRSKDPSLFKNVLNFLIRAFKFSINIVSILYTMKRPPSRRFVEMVSWIGSKVNPAICSLVKFNQETDLGTRPQSKSATKKRIEGEKKLLPELTSHMERFEHSCIRYSKLFKGARLESHFTRAAAFDFRFSVSKALGDDVGSDKRKKKRNKEKQERQEQIGDERMEEDDGATNAENDGTVSDGEGENDPRQTEQDDN